MVSQEKGYSTEVGRSTRVCLGEWESLGMGSGLGLKNRAEVVVRKLAEWT